MKKQNPFLKISNAQWWGWFAVALLLTVLAVVVELGMLSYGVRNSISMLSAIVVSIICFRHLLTIPPPRVKIGVSDRGVVLKNGIAPFTELAWDQIAEIGLLYEEVRKSAFHKYWVYLSTRELSDMERVNCNWARCLGKDGSVIITRVRWWKNSKELDIENRQLLEKTKLLSYAADADQIYALWGQKHPDDNIRCIYARMKDHTVWKVSETTYDKLRCEPNGKDWWTCLMLGELWTFVILAVMLPLL